MYIGVDLGGTNIAVGLVDESGKIVAQDSTPTINTRPYEEIVKDMAELAIKVTENAGYKKEDIKAVGIGSPGTVDNKNGVVVYANNLKMENAEIAKEFRKTFDVPVNIENDANAAAYGEYIATGVDASCFVFITLGTGVGGGVVLNGEIFRGFNNAGGELGHMTLMYDGEPCSCGRKGCWEAYASVTALISQTKKAMEENPDSLMHKLAKDFGKVNGRVAFDAAKAGDEAGKVVVNQYIKYVAEGIASVVNIFQPEKLVIGGGISKEGDYILEPLKKYVNANDYNKFMPKTEIEIARLFNDAGIVGAALAARNN